MGSARPLEQRFWEKVEKSPDCWLWCGAKRLVAGYGGVRVGTRVLLAHRVAYELSFGSIPDDVCVLHKCDNPACVRPDHLWLGSKLDNVRDMHKKGRARKATGAAHGQRTHPGRYVGAGNPRAKLDWKTVASIRDMHASGTSLAVLARKFGVGKSTVYSAVRGETWIS